MLSVEPKTPPGDQPSGPGAAAGDSTMQAENRGSHRLIASAVPEITSLRISPHGVEATLVNISESGVLAECGERLKPGSTVTVVFEGTFVPRSMEGRVARNSVSSMGKDGRLRYHVGIAFVRPIDLSAYVVAPPQVENEPVGAEDAAVGTPAEHADGVQGAAAAASESAPDGVVDVSMPSAETSAAEAEIVEIQVALPAPDVVRNRW